MSDTTTAIGRGDAGTDSSHRHVVVVGAGPAAHRLTESLHARAEAATSGSERLRITVIGEEPWLPYDRVALSTRLAAPVDLTLGDRTLWAHEDVVCEGGVRVERIDPTARTVSLSDGRQLQYDDLVLATGSSATVPPIPARTPVACTGRSRTSTGCAQRSSTTGSVTAVPRPSWSSAAGSSARGRRRGTRARCHIVDHPLGQVVDVGAARRGCRAGARPGDPRRASTPTSVPAQRRSSPRRPGE